MTLADLTSPGLIVPHLRGREVASTIKELSEVLQHGQRVPDLLPFYQATLNREFLAGTDMGGGIAFPHARVSGLEHVSFAMGRSDEPLSWGPRTPPSVRLIFLIAVPATDATQYLLLISGLARLSKDNARLAQLNSAKDAAQMLEVLQQVSLRTQPAHEPTKSPGPTKP